MSSGPDHVEHRPLPSVEIPLLRDEVRANRMRYGIAALSLAASALAIGAALWFGPAWWPVPGSPRGAPSPKPSLPPALPLNLGGDSEHRDSNRPDGATQSPPSAAKQDGPVRATRQQLANGNTRSAYPFGESPGFRAALRRAELSGEEAENIIAALTGHMDFRRCRPEHTLVVERASDGTITSFEYRAGPTHCFRVERRGDGFRARRIAVPVERRRIAKGGVVQTSLGAAFESAGLGRSLVGVFVEVFDGKISFTTDTRKGDQFRLIVTEERVGGERHRYGTVHALSYEGRRAGRHDAFWYAPSEALADYYDPSGKAIQGGWMRTPLRYDHISSPFNLRRFHPILRRVVPHNGVDYAASTGTPVWSTADGVVTFVGKRGPNGNLVTIQHARGYQSYYAHLSRFASGLKAGQTVKRRDVIGFVGSTGRSTGPHLHFGLKRNGRFVDPLAVLNGPGRMLPSAVVGRFRRTVRRLTQALRTIATSTSDD